MSKKQWRIIERMHERFIETVHTALDLDADDEDDEKEHEDEDQDEEEADAEAAVAIAYPLLMRGLGYALEVLGRPERRIFRRLKVQLALLVPPLSRDYTNLFDRVRTFSKKVTYFEDDIEVFEALEGIADDVKEFIDELRTLAVQAGDTTA